MEKPNSWGNFKQIGKKEDLNPGRIGSLLALSKIYFIQERKNAVLVIHEHSGNLLLFGGMKQITKEQNDVSIYVVSKNRWVKVHSTTNNLYDPSPTLKDQIEDSPTILETKRKKNLNRGI